MRFWKLLLVCHGNRGKWARYRKVRKSGSICLKLVHQSGCHTILSESAKMWRRYVIYRTDDVNRSGSETERLWCIWIQMILPRHGILAVNNEGMTIKQNDCTLKDCWYVSKVSVNRASTILVWSFRQSKGCIVTSMQTGVIGRIWM